MTAHIGQNRLSDPRKTCQEVAEELNISPTALLKGCQEKLSSVLTRLFRKPKNGGNPFLFAFASPKPHELATNLGEFPIATAATDGRKYYWNPKFLHSLSNDEASIVMEHETYHVVFYHSDRMHGFNARIRNIAMDYVVNSCISRDWSDNQRPGKLWGGALGDPLSLKELLNFIDGQTELPQQTMIYVDDSQFGRSPEGIYDEIMHHWNKSPRKCGTCGALSLDPKTGNSTISKPWDKDACQDCGAKPDPSSGIGEDDLSDSLDSHIDAEISKQEVQTDTMRAAQAAQAMRGTVPAGVEDMIGELMKPTLKFTDICRSCMTRKVQDTGMKNDWKRYRKRWIAANPRQYLPKRHTHMPRWCAMLDTSGSMSDDDITYGISQLKVLGNQSEGFIVPCDAKVDWNAVTPVRRMKDLERTKVVGRGGTIFDDFFENFPKHLGTDFDVIIILTDGDCGTIPLHLRPRCDVVWVLTRDHKNFKPSFGRVAPLRHQRL